MKRFHFAPVCTILFLCFTHQAFADITTQSDTIKTDLVWSDTIHVTGDVVVADDVTLDISPGTLVEFQGYYSLKILGTIKAEGEDSDSIIFTYHDTLGFMDFSNTDGGWKGILFDNTGYPGGADGAMNDNDTSTFNKCRIEFIKILFDTWVISPIMVREFSNVEIFRCEIKDNYSKTNGGAIGITTQSNIYVRGNNIHHNTCFKNGGGIFISNSAPRIFQNKIRYNKTLNVVSGSGMGGGIYGVANDGIIWDNIIIYNSAQYGSGIAYKDASGKIQKNIIKFNEGYADPGLESQGGGIYLRNNSGPVIVHNKISQNKADLGAGIFTTSSSPDIINNLVLNNTAPVAGGAWFAHNTGGSYANNTTAKNNSPNTNGILFEDSDPVFMNNILWGSDSLLHLSDVFSSLHIQNCIIDSVEHGSIFGPGSYTSVNLSSNNPGFIADWNITASSPCVNAGAEDLGDLPIPGKDFQGNNRIANVIIDIGAYEVQIDTISFQDTIKSDTTWVADTVRIRGHVVVNDDVTLTVLPGTFVDFIGSFKLKVNGTIKALGSQEKPIVFSRTDTTGFYNYASKLGGWRGIIFDNGPDGMNNEMSDNDTSVFKNCQFRFAKNPWLNGKGGAVSIKYFNNVEFSGCHFHNNVSSDKGSAIDIYKSDLTISNCTFYYNWTDEGSTFMAELSELLLSGNDFRDNLSMTNGGAVRVINSEGHVEHNRFIGNNANQGGAIYLLHSPMVVSHNALSNNTAWQHGGAITAFYAGFQLINNVIVNNTANNNGGGIFAKYASNAVTVNNTISNNMAGNTGGGFANYYTDHEAFNDIYYGNDLDPVTGKETGQQYFIVTSTSDISFKNCNIEGGADSIRLFSGDSFQGSMINCIDSLPYFVYPTPGAGIGFDGSKGKWWLKAVSPCINSGTVIPLLDSLDFRGKPRIHDSLVDMGAFESGWSVPEITLQPENQIVCTGDTVIFTVKTKYIATFQWQKDGQDIPGETGWQLRIDSVTSTNDGNYHCVVSNSFGSVYSTPAYLLARSVPVITDQPEDIWGAEGIATILSSLGTGTPPIEYQWYKDGNIIPWARYPNIKFKYSGYHNEGLYHCELSNECGTVSSDTVQLYIAPQLCMVTVDTSTNNNLIVWEKESTAPVESFNIYRESIVAGEYDLIGNVAADDLSEFTDTDANPLAQSYIYKITAMDAEGNESAIELCKPHRTIHLLSSENTELNTIQLDWTPYFGFNYGTFHIYRGETGNALDSVHSIASSSTQWIDTEALPGKDYYYRIVVLRESPCTPTGNTKAGTGPYSHALSNMDDNKLKSGENPPDSIILNNHTIDENLAPGSVVGRLSTVDTDSLKTFTYQLVEGEGDDDNNSFTLVGDLLVTAESFDYETDSSYTVRIRSVDNASNSIEMELAITVVDVAEPAVGINGFYTGETLIFPNPFSDAATIRFENTGGDPYILVLTDLSGKICRIVNDITASEYVLERQGLKKGLYFIELRGPAVYWSKVVIE